MHDVNVPARLNLRATLPRLQHRKQKADQCSKCRQCQCCSLLCCGEGGAVMGRRWVEGLALLARVWGWLGMRQKRQSPSIAMLEGMHGALTPLPGASIRDARRSLTLRKWDEKMWVPCHVGVG